MESFSMVLMALGLSADAFAVSMSSGLLIKNIKLNKALKIALFFGGFQALMPLIGWAAGLTFRDFFEQFDHWIIFILLGFLGVKMIYEALQDEEEKKFNPLDPYTLLLLATATSLDALAAGLGLSVIKTPIILAVTAIGFITFSLCFIGVFIGHKFGSLFSQKVEILGGVILIFIGSKILLEHLMI
ncbi:MAG: manganese efflux pump [Hydrococcus sp. RU_2_2]|jgi:putative Mn2+ efflux pump MntP|nr:manganese efflux pump [Hydrococcus sp. RU_2_2]NJP18366.1 manganese efflux pump [Hydrococcus sp. CRU_1_1]